MISSGELLKKDLEITQNGYNMAEVDAVISEAAATIDAYEKQSGDLYHKLEVLAGKIEEYRQEEDAIKTALVTAQKMADKITKESNETAKLLLTKSEESAKKTVADAKNESDKIINSARDYSTNLIESKNKEADEIIAKAQAKANEAISSAKVVAQDILDQAKQISDDLISKAKAEKEAYEILSNTIKQDAKEFIEKVKGLYNEELDALNSAKLDTETSDVSQDSSIQEIDDEIDDLIGEIDDFTSSIPQVHEIDDTEAETQAVAEKEAAGEAEEIIEEIEEKSQPEPEDEETEDDSTFDLNEIEYTSNEDENEVLIEEDEEDDDYADPMEAVEAFSQNEITPLKSNSAMIPEIDEEADMEEGTLFDN
ncbi:MAG TPA: hypothetical protein DCZ02_01070, partial [Ruminococcaceae bacterium]|nr:hypothetical protein [Oscillospiraceae bacterium]